MEEVVTMGIRFGLITVPKGMRIPARSITHVPKLANLISQWFGAKAELRNNPLIKSVSHYIGI
jgi:hypothetical protein